ncbi:hypothetical protein CYQ93_07840 [Acinetobacter baumannii]|nr:hypothetical protein CYQ93_07840 [Acinetobacter baumannii]
MAKMLALCCFECFFSLNFIHLFLCQCVKSINMMAFYTKQEWLNLLPFNWFNFLNCISWFIFT